MLSFTKSYRLEINVTDMPTNGRVYRRVEHSTTTPLERIFSQSICFTRAAVYALCECVCCELRASWKVGQRKEAKKENRPWGVIKSSLFHT